YFLLSQICKMLEQINSFITSFTGSDIVSYILLVIFVVAWIYSVLWVLKDVLYRSSSSSMQFVSVLFVILGTPLIGLPLYFLIRPVSYKHERHV
ncbi:hypothetical protein KBB05_05570, partial [Patescibacteria group bacterium]|nr:hypothetical protein [Patescibacteria group bacterium]